MKQAKESNIQRILGHYQGQTTGPTLIAIGGLHGNEPTGVAAINQVFAELQSWQRPFRGEFMGFAGNLAALRCQQRFIESDLNRSWSCKHLCSVLSNQDKSAEDQERRQLWKLIDAHLQRIGKRVTFLDLHTYSAQGLPFAIAGNTLRNRYIASAIPVPTILGLENYLHGTFLKYICDQGHLGIGFEAGPHDAHIAVPRHTTAMWLVLAANGNVCSRDIRQFAQRKRKLAAICKDIPQMLQVNYCHAITADDQFVMQPGFENFDRIAYKQTLAHDKDGPVLAQQKGYILMPLYQKLGDEGYFLVRRISWFHACLSTMFKYLYGVFASLKERM